MKMLPVLEMSGTYYARHIATEDALQIVANVANQKNFDSIFNVLESHFQVGGSDNHQDCQTVIRDLNSMRQSVQQDSMP